MFYQQVCLVLFRTCIIRKEFSQRWKEWLSITHQVRKLEGLEQERNGWNFQLERKNSFSFAFLLWIPNSYVRRSSFSSLWMVNHVIDASSHRTVSSVPCGPEHNLWIAGGASLAQECTVLPWAGYVPVVSPWRKLCLVWDSRISGDWCRCAEFLVCPLQQCPIPLIAESFSGGLFISTSGIFPFPAFLHVSVESIEIPLLDLWGIPYRGWTSNTEVFLLRQLVLVLVHDFRILDSTFAISQCLI